MSTEIIFIKRERSPSPEKIDFSFLYSEIKKPKLTEVMINNVLFKAGQFIHVQFTDGERIGQFIKMIPKKSRIKMQIRWYDKPQNLKIQNLDKIIQVFGKKELVRTDDQSTYLLDYINDKAHVISFDEYWESEDFQANENTKY